MTKTPTDQPTKDSKGIVVCPDALKADLSKLAATISTALKLVEKGNLVDLSALERRTQLVCDAALALPGAESRPLLPVLEGIISGLDALESALNSQFGPLPKEKSGHATTGHAASVYAKNHSAG